MNPFDLPPNAPAKTEEIFERWRPLLAGVHPAVQGAVLAQMVALYLAGNVITNKERTAIDVEETARLRSDLLDGLIVAIRDFAPIMEAEHVLPKLRLNADG